MAADRDEDLAYLARRVALIIGAAMFAGLGAGLIASAFFESVMFDAATFGVALTGAITLIGFAASVDILGEAPMIDITPQLLNAVTFTFIWVGVLAYLALHLFERATGIIEAIRKPEHTLWSRVTFFLVAVDGAGSYASFTGADVDEGIRVALLILRFIALPMVLTLVWWDLKRVRKLLT